MLRINLQCDYNTPSFARGVKERNKRLAILVIGHMPGKLENKNCQERGNMLVLSLLMAEPDMMIRIENRNIPEVNSY